VHVLQHCEDITIVFLRLGPLRPMPTVLDLQRVQFEAARKLVKLWRSRVGNVIPRKVRKDRIHATPILAPDADESLRSGPKRYDVATHRDLLKLREKLRRSRLHPLHHCRHIITIALGHQVVEEN